MALPCDRLSVFDIDTCRKLWQVKLTVECSSMAINVTTTKATIVVAWGDGSAAYDMSSGKRLWADTTPSACEDKGFAGGRSLIARVSCGDSASPTSRLEQIDPRTGKLRWT